MRAAIAVGVGLALFAAWRIDREGWLVLYTAGLLLVYLAAKRSGGHL